MQSSFYIIIISIFLCAAKEKRCQKETQPRASALWKPRSARFCRTKTISARIFFAFAPDADILANLSCWRTHMFTATAAHSFGELRD